MRQFRLSLLLYLLLLPLLSNSAGPVNSKRPRRPDLIKKEEAEYRQREKRTAEYFKNKKKKRARSSKCDQVNSTLVFSNKSDREMWEIYSCPLLLSLRKQQEENKGLIHAKCSDVYRSRLSAERWCFHARRRRVFASPRDERMWTAEDCMSSHPHAESSLSRSDEKTSKTLAKARKGKLITVLRQKYARDKWCLGAFSSLVKLKSLTMDQTIGNAVSLLSENDRVQWMTHSCVTSLKTYDRDYETCAVNSRSIETGTSTKLPVIAIMSSTTSRGHNFTNGFSRIPLFKTLLPSLRCSLECGFNYIFVMGYDNGDEFYDSEKHMTEVKKWFDSRVARPLLDDGIQISLHTVSVNNPAKRPGPAFTVIAQTAYELQADYFYRVNDDSEFLGKWPTLYTKTLQNLSLPYGVIGPSCYSSKDRILTHDFVHRTHMDIFNMIYYPTEFTDWYMDDWISAVYGLRRTFLSKNVGIDHHNRFRERSYDVNRDNFKLLAPLIKSGQEKILEWMKSKPSAVSASSISEFQTDIVNSKTEINSDSHPYQELYA